MSKSIETLRRLFSLPPVWRHRLSILAVILASLLAVYTLAGFFLAPYLITRFAPQYAAEQLHIQLRLERVRINPLLFTCEIEKLSLQTDDEPMLSVQRLFVDFELESIFRRAWTFADLAIDKPAFHLIVGKDNRLNLAKFIEQLPQSPEPPTTDKKAPLRLLLKHLTLSEGTARLTDQSTPRPTETTVTPIAFEFNNISTLPEHCGTYALSASLPGGGSLGWKGEMSLEPIAATGTVEIKNFKPASVWNHFRDLVNLEKPAGSVQLTAGYDFSSRNGETSLRVNPLTLAVRDLSLTEKGTSQPLVNIESITAAKGQLDFTAHRILFPSIILKGGRAAAKIDKAGVGNWQRLVKATPESQLSKKSSPKASPDAEKTTPWQIGIESFSAPDFNLSYSDASGPTPISLEANPSLSLTGGSLDLGRHEASIKRLALSGGGVTLTQGPSTQGTASEPPKKLPAAEQGKTKQKISADKQTPWKFMLQQLSITGFHLGYLARKYDPPLAYDLVDLKAEINDFGNSEGKPISFAAQSGMRQGGSTDLSGTISQPGGQIDAQISLERLNLKPLASLVKEHAALTLVSGDFSAKTHLRYDTSGANPSLALNGDATLGNLLLNEEDSGTRFLAWKELSTKGLDFSLNPDRLAIKELRLQDPGAKITIFKDKTLNLTKVLRQKQQAPPETSEKPPFPVSVESIRLKNGVVDFADFSLVLPFATRITELKGGATDITTRPGSRTSLRFEGRVGEFGQAKAKGALIPSNPKQFTDITVTFRNIAMSPLSPYSVTFAGRKIASGKLNLDLDYKIKDSELLGDNSVVLKDFTLGDRVESPSAIDLPLDLAVSLLTDSEGKIDVAVPIRGNVDHPDFSYGHVIRQALINLLTKIVTAPFRALGALFGGRSENPGTILFEPGRATLAPPEQEKLKMIAEFLTKKEELKLTVHGGFEPSLDTRALKRAQLRRTLRQDLGAKPGPMAYDNAKTQRALEELAGDTLAAFQAEYEKKTGRKAIRVNPVLALLGRASEDHDFYRALFDHLVENASLPKAELEKLADERGMAIVQELTTRFKGDTTRITLGTPVQTEEQEESVPAKLELGVH